MVDFTVDNQRPGAGEIITFEAITDKANVFEWSFFPNTGVKNEGPTSTLLRERSFSFSQPGKYTVQLKAFNYIDSANSAAGVIKGNYIIVVDPCISNHQCNNKY